ncbi:carboxymuconolactone decarboxylase family protein [Acuticoccus sediminis]|uniref:carboxymuconolactone decarboxylase family protein n=1 Tax=Acuticoccus sediminis TaxID=2184697 RepID=UPI001CFEE561|nr:carboxymuconolactone decarboxylase family protein [Acuticoccus sediminis]
MRKIAILAGALAMTGPTAKAQEALPVEMERLGAVSPALQAYTADDLFGSVWQDSALSQRDRALLTVAALIARSEDEGLAEYIDLAIDRGVTPAEISETITHLAFYAGWQNAMKGVDAAAEVFEARNVTAADLPAVEPQSMLPLDQKSEDQRQSFVQERFGNVSQGVVDNTEKLLFLDLWLRPALAPRDRSLVTVSALIATGKVEQVTFHLNRAMDNGLTKDEASAALAHLAFYAGWPNIFSAMPVVKEVFDSREG